MSDRPFRIACLFMGVYNPFGTEPELIDDRESFLSACAIYYDNRDDLDKAAWGFHSINHVIGRIQDELDLLESIGNPHVPEKIRRLVIDRLREQRIPKSQRPPPPPSPRAYQLGSIYLAKSGTHPLTKIGFSRKPQQRLKAHRATDPTFEMFFVSCPRWTIPQEESIHGRYSELRRSGEWFDLNSNHIDEITTFLSGEAA